MIKVKHFLDRPRKDDGRRFWVQPIGITRDLRAWCRIDGDLKDLAPPRELWEWFREHPDQYTFFRDAYHAHLAAGRCATLRQLSAYLGAGAITLVHDEDHASCNTAAALRDYLLRTRTRADSPPTPMRALCEELAAEAGQMREGRTGSDDTISAAPTIERRHARARTHWIRMIHRGLALYDGGNGEPVLLIPDPGGLTAGPEAEGPLAHALLTGQHRVVTFDPPGAFRSTRPAVLGVTEIVACACESLDHAEIPDPVDVVAAGSACLCATAFAVARPQRVRRLLLIGPIPGAQAAREYHALPWCWNRTDPRFWHFLWLHSRLSRGRGTLADHKRLLNLAQSVSYCDPSYASPHPIIRGDRKRDPPLRYLWERNVEHLAYEYQLARIRVPTLVMAGRFDRQSPVSFGSAIALRIPYARFDVFEFSGHAPYVEERELFLQRVAAFFRHGLAATT